MTVKDAANPTLAEVMDTVGHNKIAINFVWTLLAGFLVMFMQAGFAMVETGFCRAKNAAHTMSMNFMVYPIGMLGYWVCGYALQMGGVGAVARARRHARRSTTSSRSTCSATRFGLFGMKGFFLSGNTYDVGVFTLFLFQMVFMDTAVTIPTGAMAERWKFSSFCRLRLLHVRCSSIRSSRNWVWGGGWLSHARRELRPRPRARRLRRIVGRAHGRRRRRARRRDRPRSAHRQVHQGRRAGRRSPATTSRWRSPARSSWRSAGSASTRARRSPAATCASRVVATNTMLAGTGGALAAMFYRVDASRQARSQHDGQRHARRPRRDHRAVRVRQQRVGGASSAASPASWSSSRCSSSSATLKIDDPVGAIAVHGVNGAWGVLSLGLFADGTYGDGWNGVPGTVKGLFYGDASQFAAQASAR